MAVGKSTPFARYEIHIHVPDDYNDDQRARLCRRLPNCKILLFSADTESSEILERAKKDGIDFPVLAKPISPEELLATLQRLLKISQRPQRGVYSELHQGRL